MRTNIPHSCSSIDRAIKELKSAKDELKDVLRGLGALDDGQVSDLVWSIERARDCIEDAEDHFEEARRINGDLRDKLEEALERIEELERMEIPA